MRIMIMPRLQVSGAARCAVITCSTIAIASLGSPGSLAQNLVLFPNSTVTVLDNNFPDTNPAIGVIEILPANAVPVPDITGSPSDIVFVGEIRTYHVGPTNTQGAAVSVTISNISGSPFGGWFTNNSSFRRLVGSTPANRFDYADMVEFVFVDYPSISGAGSLSAEINAELGQLVGGVLVDPANNNTLDQQLNLGVSATTFVGNNFQDFAYAHAWPDPGPTYNSVQPMIEGPNSHSGNFFSGAGTLQIHIDDALVLGGNDTIQMPNSIEIVMRGSPIPEPTTWVMFLLAMVTVHFRRDMAALYRCRSCDLSAFLRSPVNSASTRASADSAQL